MSHEKGKIKIESTNPEICGPCEMLVRIGDETIAHIAPYLSRLEKDLWYWYAWSDAHNIKPINTLTNNENIPTIFEGYEKAEESCLRYLKERLRLK